MFGYLRPDKDTLLVKEFAIFKATYCGLCKTIKSEYGNIPRVSVSYDMTVLALLMLSLDENDALFKRESCILNPLVKKPIAHSHPALEFCSAASVIFSYYKLDDEVNDAGRIDALAAKSLFRHAYLMASKKYPEIDKAIGRGISNLTDIENGEYSDNVYSSAASAFGRILSELMGIAFAQSFSANENNGQLRSAMSLLGADIGEWIYVIDAIDDYNKDIQKGEWNPFLKCSFDKAKEYAEIFLVQREEDCDRIGALLPFNRNAGIISNIFQIGMPIIRSKVFAGTKLGRL